MTINVQCCTKVMGVKFVKLHCFSILLMILNKFSNEMRKYLGNIVATIVLTHSEFSDCTTKSRSASSKFLISFIDILLIVFLP